MCAAAHSQSQGIAVLYETFAHLRFYFRSQFGVADSEDLYHQFVVALADCIRQGAVRHPEKLSAYANSMAKHMVSNAIRAKVWDRQKRVPLDPRIRGAGANPEMLVARKEEVEIAYRILKRLSARDREVLIRFYLKEQTAEEIEHDLGLSSTQFRLIKSRAKARFIEKCKGSLSGDRRTTARSGRLPSSW